VGLCYSLFEGAMYVFVFNWVPTLAAASGGFGAFAPVQGLLFSCLMAAISIGGELYNYAFGAAPVEGIGVAIYASASVCMTLLVVCSCTDCGAYAFLVQFGACLGFEVCVGAFQPCIATHRSKYVPDAQQSTVNNLFRLPLNIFVAAGTILSDHLPPHQIFAVCAAAHALATLCELRLAWLGRKGGVAQASAQAAGPKKVRAATPKARSASPKARTASPARSSRDRRSPQRQKKTQ
jgi:hypothetical protein